MDSTSNWILVGNTLDLINELESQNFLKEITLDEKRIVISYHEGQFGAVNGKCNHMGGPLAKGQFKNGCIECPWHYWQFHHKTGAAHTPSVEPLASDGGTLPTFPLKIENNNLFINIKTESERVRPHYNTGIMNLSREPKRESGKIRVLGISTTAMDANHPRYSTSEDLLKTALQKGQTELDIDIQMLSLANLSFRHCEGFYSKSEKACTWPCSITKMDPKDEMAKIYEALVHWADVVFVATPIRWGAASSLYYKMAERLNSIQNQITLKDRVLIRDKVASFIITGGQDNIQSVAGQMLTFFGELGFISPPFPFVGHSRGWSAEDMENNMEYVQRSEYLHQHTFELLQRSIDLSKKILNL
ncbi:MAG: NAD(P)H-dependent oxidoreductase [Bdellovibrionaceae bacterium]|nr:NAD(P)H-dependent oxidoreductase [Pseudobdellovibrionaceae bacterium]